MKKIDVEKAIEAKNPKVYHLLPRFLISYLKKIVHENEFNDFLKEGATCYDFDFVEYTLKKFDCKVESVGLENIPKEGGCIVVCNHPLGGLDGIAVLNQIGKIRHDVKAIVNDLLMNLENLESLLIPVNKYGNNTIEFIKKIDFHYSSSDCIVVFPAGLVSRKNDRIISDLEWQKSFITKAIKYNQPIIPLFVDAKNSNFFYNLARFRKKIGVKMNLEMLFLVDEVFKQKGKTIKLKIGNPISPSVFTKKHSHLEWAQKIKTHVYHLAKNNTLMFSQ